MGGPEFRQGGARLQLVGRAPPTRSSDGHDEAETRPFEFLRRTPARESAASSRTSRRRPSRSSWPSVALHPGRARCWRAQARAAGRRSHENRDRSETNPTSSATSEQGPALKIANVVGQEFADRRRRRRGCRESSTRGRDRAKRRRRQSASPTRSWRRDQAAPGNLRGPRHPGGPDLQLVLREVTRRSSSSPCAVSSRPSSTRSSAKCPRAAPRCCARTWRRRAAAQGGSSRRPRARSSHPFCGPRGCRRADSPRGTEEEGRSCERLRTLRARSSAKRIVRRPQRSRSSAPRSRSFVSRTPKEGFAPGSRSRRADDGPAAAIAAAAEQLQALRVDAARLVEATPSTSAADRRAAVGRRHRGRPGARGRGRRGAPAPAWSSGDRVLTS